MITVSVSKICVNVNFMSVIKLNEMYLNTLCGAKKKSMQNLFALLDSVMQKIIKLFK